MTIESKKYAPQPAAILLTIAAALLRLVPHPPNFTPIGATAMFGGARLQGWSAYLIPLLAMLVTDPILSHMAGYPAYSLGTLVVYACLLTNVFLGRKFLRNTLDPRRIGAVTLAGSLWFFTVTNFFVWLQAPALYPHSASGLLQCYIAAIPFFGRTLAADLFYVAVLFIAHTALTRRSAETALRLDALRFRS